MCIDGPAGSGKTTLADQLEGSGARVVHLDDLYTGWSGLGRAPGQIRALLGPLARGHSAAYRRWDWWSDRAGPSVRVPPTDLLVVEGVGAGTAPEELITVLVWVAAPAELCLARGRERGGAGVEDSWARWAAQEEALFTAYRIRERAEVLVDGTGARPVQVVDR